MWDPEFQPLRASRNHSKKGDVQCLQTANCLQTPHGYKLGMLYICLGLTLVHDEPILSHNYAMNIIDGPYN